MTMDQQALEKSWIEYQRNIASLRCVVPDLLTVAFDGRQQHTFTVDQGLPNIDVHRLIMCPTPDTPHGIPNLMPSYFVGRLISVHTAGIILLVANSTVQRLARDLCLAEGFRFDAGDTIATEGQQGARAAALLHAGANLFRHIDEWSDDAADWGVPKDPEQRKRHAAQLRSMNVISAVLGEPVPIHTNFCYEIVEALFGTDRHYRNFEWHLLRIGQDAMTTAGMRDPIVGLTVTQTKKASDVADLAPDTYVKMSGVLRAAD